MQASATSCINLTKWPPKHTGMTFLRKEVPAGFPGGQGSAGIPCQSVPSHFEPWFSVHMCGCHVSLKKNYYVYCYNYDYYYSSLYYCYY